MALDPSIALQIKQPQFDNPLAQMAQFSAVQNAQNQNQLAQYTLAKAKREDEDTQAVRNLLTGAGGDLEAGYNALLKGGYLDKAMAIKKQQQEQDKIKSEIGKNNATAAKTATETLGLKLTQHKDLLSQISTPQQAAAWVTAGYNDPDIGSMAKRSGATLEDIIAKIPTDPAAFQQWKAQSAMSADKLIQYIMPDANAKLSASTTLATNTATNATSLATNAATNATSRANNADTVAATREGYSKPVWDADRGVFVDPRSGLATAAVGTDGKPLGAKDKPLTETQGKATAFAARAQEADKLIASLDGKYSPAAINSKASVENTPLVGGMLGAATNSFALSAADQRAEQAQRDFINAILRQESGAAIGKDEFNNARKQYFPQPGDDATTLAQKAANRKLAIEGLKTQAGPGASKINSMIDVAGKTAAVGKAAAKSGDPDNYTPKAGTVEGGYRFKGGDPRNPSAWEKV